MTKHEDTPYLEHIADAINDTEESINDLSKGERIYFKQRY